MDEQEAAYFFGALAFAFAAYQAWRWRPTRVAIVTAVMAVWGAVAVLAPVTFAVQRFGEGRFGFAALTVLAAVPIATPYVAFACPAFIRFLKNERLWR